MSIHRKAHEIGAQHEPLGLDGWHDLLDPDGTPIGVAILIEDGRAIRLHSPTGDFDQATLADALVGYGVTARHAYRSDWSQCEEGVTLTLDG